MLVERGERVQCVLPTSLSVGTQVRRRWTRSSERPTWSIIGIQGKPHRIGKATAGSEETTAEKSIFRSGKWLDKKDERYRK